MDFMNLMNQINGLGCGNNNCGCDLNQGCMNNRGFRSSELLPLLLLSGLGRGGQNSLSGNLTCYPNNQCQQFVMPTSSTCCGSNVKYRTRKVRQAYMEVPVSTYQVAQPFFGMPQQPMNMNIMPVGGNRNGVDLWSILLLLFLFNRNNRSLNSHHGGSNNVSSEL